VFTPRDSRVRPDDVELPPTLEIDITDYMRDLDPR
jgi:hypothetical protein